MGWREEVGITATYKNIPFRVRSIDLGFGWQLSDESTPNSSSASGDGTDGVKAAAIALIKGVAATTQTKILPRVFDVVISFSGEEYTKARREFIAALEEGGSGTLVLPTFEPIIVSPERGRSRFDITIGNYEELLIRFVQAGDKTQPVKTTNTKGALSDFAGVAGTAADDQEDPDDADPNIIDSFSLTISSGAKFVEELAVESQELLSESILGTLYRGAKSTLDAFDTASELALSLSNDASTLIQTPTTLANQIYDTLENLTAAFENPVNAFNAQLQLFEDYNAGLPALTSNTPSEISAVDNQNAMTQIVQNAALLQMGQAIADADFSSIDEALSIKALFDDAARTQQLENGDTDGGEESYKAIAKLMGLVSAHISNLASLPSVVDLEFNERIPSLVLAEDLYGDADRASEIVDMNNVKRPMFCDINLSVLSE